jgi:hypothetical protein
MEINATKVFGFRYTSRNARNNVLEDKSIPLIPEAPATGDDNFHYEFHLVSVACIRDLSTSSKSVFHSMSMAHQKLWLKEHSKKRCIRVSSGQVSHRMQSLN